MTDWVKQYDAPTGTVWVCGACGKAAKNRATGDISRGWDESCMMHATLCYEEHSHGWVRYGGGYADHVRVQD